MFQEKVAGGSELWYQIDTMRLTSDETKRARRWLGLTQSELARAMNVSLPAVKRYEKSGCGGAAARLLQLLTEQPIANRPGRKPTLAQNESHRPRFRSIQPEDWPAVRGYDVCEPKLDGHFAELSCGAHGFKLLSRGLRTLSKGRSPLPRAHLLCENLEAWTTEWARCGAPSELAGRWVAFAALDQRGRHLPRAQLVRLVEQLRDAGLPVVAMPQYPIAQAPELWDRYVEAEGFEGLVFRTRDGASFAKMKPRFAWDYICTGIEGRSAIGGLFTQRGALIRSAVRCVVPKGVEIEPGDVFEAMGLQLSDRGTLRSPRFLRLRPDKPAEECITPLAYEKLI